MKQKRRGEEGRREVALPPRMALSLPSNPGLSTAHAELQHKQIHSSRFSFSFSGSDFPLQAPKPRAPLSEGKATTDEAVASFCQHPQPSPTSLGREVESSLSL